MNAPNLPNTPSSAAPSDEQESPSSNSIIKSEGAASNLGRNATNYLAGLPTPTHSINNTPSPPINYRQLPAYTGTSKEPETPLSFAHTHTAVNPSLIIERLMHQNPALMEDLTQLRRMLGIQNDRHAQLLEANEDEIVRLQYDLMQQQTASADLGSRLAKTQNELAECVTSIQSLEETTRSQQIELEKAGKKLTEAEEEIEQSFDAKKSLRKEIVNLLKEKAATETRQAEIEQSMASTEVLYSVSKSDRDDKVKLIDSLRLDKENLAKDKAQLQKDLDDEKGRVGRREAEVMTERRQVEALRSELKTKSGEISSKDERIKRQWDEIVMHRGKIEEMGRIMTPRINECSQKYPAAKRRRPN